MKQNRLRRSLLAGDPVVGTIVQLPCPEVVEVVGRAGFDYIMVDLEHGPYGVDVGRALVRAADAVGISALWRVQRNDPALIMQALDIGVAGVVIPGVSGVDDAAVAAAAARFTPRGERGFCSAVRAAGYLAPPDYLATANREILVMPIVENRQAAEQCDGILALEGIDMVMIGPGDLSHSLGVPGQWDHPAMRAAIDSMLLAAARTGKWIGMHVKIPDDAHRYRQMGVHLLNYGIDAQIVYQAFAEIARAVSLPGVGAR